MILHRISRGLAMFVLLVSQSLSAQEASPVFEDPDQAGQVYQLQGEYLGWLQPQSSIRSRQRLGVQVVALGNGEFSATKYYGGLPGDGWYGGERYVWPGELAGDIARFRRDPYVMEADGDLLRVYDDDNEVVGELTKVHRESPTMHTAPPAGAVLLFGGNDASGFVNPKLTADGLLMGGTETVEPYANFRLHAEFRIPFKPDARGQDRGNSGFYLQSRYEVQVLDSFGLDVVENGCGALYRTRKPDFNMCYPPLTWQTYDIDFSMPQFNADGEKIKDMKIAVWQNGVLVQNNIDLSHKTGAGQPEGPQPLPTKLQDHGNPVVFRNVWLLPKESGEPASAGWVRAPQPWTPVPIQQFAPPAGSAVIGLGALWPSASVPSATCP